MVLRKIGKVILGLVALVVIVVVGLGAAAQARWDRTFDVPEPALRASTDPAVIAHGRYLAYGPAHCAYCHTTAEQWPKINAGETPPLTGGNAFVLPVGTFYTANLTPDPETGIGRMTDGQIARMLRHGVRRDGRAAVPFMQFQNMSDEDIVALISFLRSQPAVRNPVPAHAPNALGKTILAYVIKPVGPEATPPVKSPAEAPTVERGAYLANNVAECVGCHTERSKTDGSYIGPRFAGGMRMDIEGNDDQVLVTPNLTPDPKTGRIASWTEEQFLARFRAGKMIEGSHMPWVPFGKMSDDDIRAIYRYLRSLPPVEHETGPSLQPKEK